jgi:hypothetical protein
VDSGQWTVDSGQWTVDSGQWTDRLGFRRYLDIQLPTPNSQLPTPNSLLGALNPEETSGTRIRNSQLPTLNYLNSATIRI